MRLLTTILLLLIIPLFACPQSYEVSREIIWQNPDAGTDSLKPHLRFFHAGYPDSTSQPFFYELFTLPPGSDLSGVTLINAVYGPLTEAESGAFGTPVGDTAVVPVFRKETSAMQDYAAVSIFPFRKNPVSGFTEKLLRFRLQISYRTDRLKSGTMLKRAWTDHSVLATGRWCKVKIVGSGIYTLSYEKLKSMGFNDPDHVKVYGNGGAMLPVANSDPRDDDLQEIPVWKETGSGGQFGPGNFILFYARGIVNWSYNSASRFYFHSENKFSDAAYYFLTEDLGSPSVIQYAPQTSTPSGLDISTFDDYAEHELDQVNLIHSGAEWYGENFNLTTHYSFSFDFADFSTTDSVYIYSRLVARYSSSTSYSLQLNSQYLGQLTLPGVPTTSSTDDYASKGSLMAGARPGTGRLTLDIDYNKADAPMAEGWLDFIDVNVKRNLNLSGAQLAFRSSRNIGAGNVSTFHLGNAGAGVMVWDVTDLHHPMLESLVAEGQGLKFNALTDRIREFVAVDPGAALPEPVTSGEDVGWLKENQDLHGISSADMVIVTHPEFLEQARDLAELHRMHDHLNVALVTTDQVYNEFSSGAPDVAAIRDFMKMLYDRGKAGGTPPSYLLLFGDGSFDNKRHLENNPNFILTYQSPNSLTQSASFVTDDFYGLLDDNEGGYSGLLDVGIGRLPVKDTLEARAMVNKVRWYIDPLNRKDWRNMICFIGDDGDNNIHMQQADELADYVGTNYPAFAIEKIYLDAYQQVVTAAGPTYPDVNQAILRRINKGSLIVNYTGHGNEIGLAHERILQDDAIRNLENGPLLPLFVTATCEFSRFDDVNQTAVDQYSDATSAGEHLLLNDKGGAIALFSTTRLVYSGPNFTLNEQFYRYVFQRDANGQPYRLGDIIRLSKNSTGSGINKLNFTLLGDPALVPAYPDLTVVTDSIDGIPISLFADTLKAYQKVTVTGHVESFTGMPLNEFTGDLYPMVFDKAATITTLGNKGDVPITFTTYNSILFKGWAGVANGRFSFSYIVPRDINYAVGPGKIIYYANDTATDAHGFCNGILTGGLSSPGEPDTNGPEIKLFMNDTTFVNGGITSQNPVLLAYLTDENGINTTGTGIGHDITMNLDRDDKAYLNDYYQSARDSYVKGYLVYPMKDLQEGQHTLSLKVWDVYNNSSEASLDFVVVTSAQLELNSLMNYPNPFTDETWFTFRHNHAGEMLDIQIDIVSLSGQTVKIIRVTQSDDGFETSPIPWDGRNYSGQAVARGIYIYHIRVKTPEGQVAERSGKMMLLR